MKKQQQQKEDEQTQIIPNKGFKVIIQSWEHEGVPVFQPQIVIGRNLYGGDWAVNKAELKEALWSLVKEKLSLDMPEGEPITEWPPKCLNPGCDREATVKDLVENGLHKPGYYCNEHAEERQSIRVCGHENCQDVATTEISGKWYCDLHSNPENK